MVAQSPTVVLFRDDGTLVAAKGRTDHVAAACAAVMSIRSTLPPDTIALSNDPYTGGLTLSDVILFARRSDGIVCIADHYPDFGAMKESAFCFIRECAHEGLRLKDVRLAADAPFPEWLARFVRANLCDGDGALAKLQAQRDAAFASIPADPAALDPAAASRLPAFARTLDVEIGAERCRGELRVESGAIRLSLDPLAPDPRARNASSSATWAVIAETLAPAFGLRPVDLLACPFRLDAPGPHRLAVPYPYGTAGRESVLAPLRRAVHAVTGQEASTA